MSLHATPSGWGDSAGRAGRSSATRRSSGAGERAAMSAYHRRRNAHALPIYHDTLWGAADLRTLLA